MAGSEFESTGDTVFRMGLFGPASFNVGGKELRFKSLKLRAALGYIALNESLTETRERLVGLLWSESPEELARASLRQNVREFRVALQGVSRTGVYIAPHEIGFERGSIDVDVWAVMRAAEAGKIHPLLLDRPNLADDLLAGLEDLDPSFRSWLLAKRHMIRDRLLRSLENALAGPTEDLAGQGDIAQAILNLDPTHEEAARRLMRARATMGDTAGALRVYKALWDLLDDDYGMEPTDATQKLVADIKIGLLEPPAPSTGRTGPASTVRGAPGPLVSGRPGIVRHAPVVRDTLRKAAPDTPAQVHPGPFGLVIVGTPEAEIVSDVSGSEVARTMPETPHATRLWLSVQHVAMREIEPAKAHLVSEFRQHLIASLVRFREWLVADAPAPGAPGGLSRGVAGHYNIEMLAYQTDSAINMMMTLKELDSGLYVWSENFELNLENWFAIQRHVVRRIAMGLNVHLSAERLRRFSDQPDISLGIYDRWLRCTTLGRTFDPVYWENVAQQFREITVEAPGFGPAYVGLANMHNTRHISFPGIFRSADSKQAALGFARKAVQLDASDMRAHLSLAWSHLMAKQFDQALLYMEVAYDLNPHDSWTVIAVALITAFCGQPKRAAELARHALDLSLAPSLTHWVYQLDIQYLSGDYEAAIAAADRSQNFIWVVPAWRAAALAQLGRVEEAAAAAAEALAKIRANWCGSGPPTDGAIMKWMLHVYPFRRRDDWEHLRDGLARASFPVGSIGYDDL